MIRGARGSARRSQTKSRAPSMTACASRGGRSMAEGYFWDDNPKLHAKGVVELELNRKSRKEKRRRNGEADPRDLDGFDLTEDGVALAFAAKFRDRLRY